jgi:hypothetical protein
MNVPTPSIAFISHQVRGGNPVAKENCLKRRAEERSRKELPESAFQFARVL